LRKIAVSFLVSFLVIFMLGVFTPKPEAFAGPKVLKMAAIGPMSGPAAPYGIPIKYGAQMAVKEINDAGGINVGGQKYIIELISIDDRGTADGGRAAGRKAVYDQGIKYIIGSSSGPATVAMQEITDPAKVFTFSTTWVDAVTSPDKPYSLAYLFTSVWLYPALYKSLAESHPEWKKVAMINSSTRPDIGRDCKVGIAYGGQELIIEKVVTDATQDFTPVLTAILAKNPDIIDTAGVPPLGQALIAKQARMLGYKGPLATAMNVPVFALWKIAGKEAFNNYWSGASIDPTVPDPRLPGAHEYYLKWLKFYPDTDFMMPSILFYDMPYIYKAAIEKAESIDTTKVMKVMEKMYFDLILGRSRLTGDWFFGTNRRLAAPAVIAVIQDGIPRTQKIYSVVEADKLARKAWGK
jgi:branched-chain amino acid transport system substrate-binding protein